VTRVVGVDPGSLRTGWGVVEVGPSRAISHVDNGVIVTGEALPLAQRLCVISRRLGEVLAEFRPAVASVETAYHAKNARSALVLGQARGVAVVVCALAGLEVVEYGPMQVKQAVTGNGRASKESVQAMVAVLLGLREVAQQDASDALAMALTHVLTGAGPGPARPPVPNVPRAKGGSRAAWTAFVQGRISK
jgi:crossover junction endodeoxyribonuclease RuvC